MKVEIKKQAGFNFWKFLRAFLHRRPSTLLCFLLLTFCFALSAAPASAQEEFPPNAAPPPVKYLTKEEKTVLDAERDFKKRAKLALEMMDVRLKKAEGLFAEDNFNPMFDELGIFHALMDLTFIYLRQNNTGGGKNLDTFKRFEIALRGFAPRLEAIRRELPDRYEYYVRRLLKNMRDTRAKAVEPFFGETVLPDDEN